MALRPGDPLPDVVLREAGGGEVRLGGLGGEHTLLIFLRHLAWLPCREHLVEVLDHREELDVRVVVVAFASPASLAAYRERLGLGGAVLLSDEPRAAYAAFGFDRASVVRAYLDPRVWWRYARLLARGRRLERPEEDTLQLGGDVLVGPDGRVRWIHHSRGPEDRPGLARLLAARRATLPG